MKQILQNLRTGETKVTDLPAPACSRGMVKIQTTRSLISAGTERMLVEFSQGGLLAKAKAQPDKVKQVLDKIKTEGLLPTLDSVFKRLGEPLPLGYCNVGKVIEVGPGVTEFSVGDRVASNGPHAEIVCVPKHLCAKIPDNISDEAASFTVLSSIGLQGIRLAEPTLGEKFVVFGAGLIGLVTIQLLRASGCEVMAIDLNARRLELAKAFGAETCDASSSDPIVAGKAWTNGNGVDGAIITASAKTDDIVHQAAEMSRKRGRIILVGVVGLNLSRADFYEKELTFQVSCSYGPGRYDDTYELMGQDYPLGFVRWTEQRNFEAVLGSMSTGQLDIKPLISHHFKLHDAARAYEAVQNDRVALGVLLEYTMAEKTVEAHRPQGHNGGGPPSAEPLSPSEAPPHGGGAVQVSSVGTGTPVLAMLGAGNFAKMTMAPALAKTGARLKYVSDLSNGPAAQHVARKYGFELATSDTDAVLADEEVDAILIATGHSSHAALVYKGLEAGKHVFVEKPLAMNVEEVKSIVTQASRLSAKRESWGVSRESSDAAQASRLSAEGESWGVSRESLDVTQASCLSSERESSDLNAGPQQPHNSQPHNSQLTTHDSQLTTHDSQLTTHDPQLTTHNSQLTTHDPQLTTHNPQLTTHDPQLTTHNSRPTTVTVGFNRRFSPHTIKIKELLAGRSEPLAMTFTANAGIIPPDVWVHDPEKGGGRIIGEACHFIDLLSFIADSRVVSIAAMQMGKGVAIKEDKMSIVLSFADGSVGMVNYFGNGNKSYPKEQLQVYSEGRVLDLDNFRVLRGYGFKGFKKFKTKMDKGHKAEFVALAMMITEGGKPLIPLEQSVNTTLASFAAMTSAAEQRTVLLDEEYGKAFSNH